MEMTDLKVLQERYEKGEVKKVLIQQILKHGKLLKTEWRDLNDVVIRSDIVVDVDASFFAMNGIVPNQL